MLNGFKLSHLRFNLEALEPITLPYTKGAALRGAVGVSFKRTVCAYKDINKDCTLCILNTVCPYPAVFEPCLKSEDILKRFSNPPRPFVIKPPLGEKLDFRIGEVTSFEIVAVGKSINLIPYLVLAVKELESRGIGKTRGRFKVRGIHGRNYNTRTWEDIFDSEKNILTSIPPKVSWSDFLERAKGLSQRSIELSFLTPTKIRFQEKTIFNPDFSHIIKRLIERLNAISYFYCDETLGDETLAILERAKDVQTVSRDVRWVDAERHSTKTGHTHSIGDFIGNISFEGDLGDFIPFLLAGEPVHVGKSTTFGNGWYMVVS